MALVVDDLGLSFGSVTRVRNSLRKFVDRELQPGDLVAIVRTGAGISALQQFTSDPRLLHAAIDHVQFSMIGRVGVSTFAAVHLPEDEDITAPGSGHGYDAYSGGTPGALAYVVEGLRELPGRKSIVLFSENPGAVGRGPFMRSARATCSDRARAWPGWLTIGRAASLRYRRGPAQSGGG
jgi:VWFA-related protein